MVFVLRAQKKKSNSKGGGEEKIIEINEDQPMREAKTVLSLLQQGGQPWYGHFGKHPKSDKGVGAV